MRLGVLVCGALLTALLWAATASAEPYVNLTADASRDPGQVSFTVIGATSLTNVRFGELDHGTFEPLGTVGSLPYFETDPVWGDLGIYTQEHVTTWRCDRLDRTFAVVATAPDGTDVSATYQNRTPSCAHRFVLEGPVRVEPGTLVNIDVRDTFDLGNAAARFCDAPPGADLACHQITFGPGQTIASGSFTPRRRGHWRVVVRSGGETLRRDVSVGVRPRPQDLARLPSVLATGDSLMEGPDAILEDRLDGRRATVHSDIYVGSGLTRPFIVDWAGIPSGQVARLHPDATLLFLGVNDESPITPPDGGTPVQCCGADWVTQYARLARAAMTAYAAGGKPVLWLNVPTPRDPRRQPNEVAVNQALTKAAAGLPTVHVIDVNAVLTPGDVYRESMPYRGKTVRVRQADGVHLSAGGSRIVDTILIAQLRRYGVI